MIFNPEMADAGLEVHPILRRHARKIHGFTISATGDHIHENYNNGAITERDIRERL